MAALNRVTFEVDASKLFNNLAGCIDESSLHTVIGKRLLGILLDADLIDLRDRTWLELYGISIVDIPQAEATSLSDGA